MTRSRPSAASLAGALLLCLAAGTAAATAALDSLVASERAFARRSVQQGVREAFLAYLAEDGVIFRPFAVSGRKVWESRGPVPILLLWEPAYAEVSAAGDLGFTTGPWELRPNDPERPFGYGHFVSVWQTQPDGSWRVVLDIGTSHRKPDRGIMSRDFTAGPEHRAAKTAQEAPDLKALDLAWTADARARGSEAAFTRRAAPDVRFYRDGLVPVVGVSGAREMVKAVPGVTLWDPEAQLVARSGDLGCTYGLLERRATASAALDSSVYLHVWRRGTDGRWKVALALENPLPKTGK